MRATERNETELVAAAQAGDRRALDHLATAYLPLVYTLVGRALDGRAEVDDVVQEVMLRALRQLPALRDAESFRLWLTSIAVRQVGTHLARSARAERRTTALDEAEATADAAFEGAALLRAELSGQRHQTQRAGRWLDPDDRLLLSLWWLEVADELTRTDLAATLGVSVAHAGVRVQRMRGQLEVSRAVVAALEARPRCPGLTAAMAGWDGAPSPLWRKRAMRHVRDCAACGRAAQGLLPADRLFPVLVLLPVPAGLAAAVLGELALGKAGTVAAAATATGLSAGGGATTGGAAAGAGAACGTGVAAGGGATVGGTGTGPLGAIAQAIGAHPIIATVTAGALAVGAAVGTARVVTPAEPARPPSTAAAAAPAPTGASSPTDAASPTPATATIALGPVSLESANSPGTYVSTTHSEGILVAAGPGSATAVRKGATFEAVEGLANARCYSFRFTDGRYLRHSSWRLRLNRNERTALFRGDATFCPRPRTREGTVELESANYPGWFLRHRGDQLWVDQSDRTDRFRADSAFRVRAPLAG